ncbi:MAG TPA: YgcG family protein, partial [Burkholderiales bacterium]|nr:YgcG family protein [Burkholderiales bacterium]
MSLAQRLLGALLLCFAAAWATAEVPVPQLKARVTDLAGALTSAQRTALEERLAAFEAKKGSQIAVLIVPTTQPEAIEQYGIRVAEAWKVGRKDVDDGAILLVALNDRAVRIEVGYGLEGVLPDAIAKRIIDEDIVPRFRSGDYYGGIEAGVSRMIRVVEGEPLPPPRARAPAQQDIGLQELFVLGMLLVFVAGGILRAMFGRMVGSGVVGAVGGFVAFMLVGSLLAAIVLGIVVALFSAIAGGASRFPPGRGGWYP